MIQPLLADDALLADIDAARNGDGWSLWWLGQSGFLVQCRGRRLLLDPYLSDSLTRKYADTDKPHVRMTALALAPERLPVDVVTSSHVHTDHLDGETLRGLVAANPELALIVPTSIAAVAAERSGRPMERLQCLDAGESVEAAGFRITAIPAAHEQLETDESGRQRHLGYVVESSAGTIYHSGDTLWYDELERWLAPWRIDIALLPINGRRPERRVAGNLWGDEAARLGRAIGAGLVIPCHYEMFEFNTESPELFRQEAARVGQPIAILRCGERWNSTVAY